MAQEWLNASRTIIVLAINISVLHVVPFARYALTYIKDITKLVWYRHRILITRNTYPLSHCWSVGNYISYTWFIIYLFHIQRDRFTSGMHSCVPLSVREITKSSSTFSATNISSNMIWFVQLHDKIKMKSNHTGINYNHNNIAIRSHILIYNSV